MIIFTLIFIVQKSEKQLKELEEQITGIRWKQIIILGENNQS